MNYWTQHYSLQDIQILHIGDAQIPTGHFVQY